MTLCSGVWPFSSALRTLAPALIMSLTNIGPNYLWIYFSLLPPDSLEVAVGAGEMERTKVLLVPDLDKKYREKKNYSKKT